MNKKVMTNDHKRTRFKGFTSNNSMSLTISESSAYKFSRKNNKTENNAINSDGGRPIDTQT